MKKALLTSALALSLAIPAIGYAQQTTPQTGGPGWQQDGKRMRGDGMMKDLNLTQKQKEQVHASMEKQRLETQKQVRAIRTPEQQKTYDQKIAQREAKMQERMQKRQQKQQTAPK